MLWCTTKQWFYLKLHILINDCVIKQSHIWKMTSCKSTGFNEQMWRMCTSVCRLWLPLWTYLAASFHMMSLSSPPYRNSSISQKTSWVCSISVPSSSVMPRMNWTRCEGGSWAAANRTNKYKYLNIFLLRVTTVPKITTSHDLVKIQPTLLVTFQDHLLHQTAINFIPCNAVIILQLVK